MSRIQDILKKAERDGGVHRTRALSATRDGPPPRGSPRRAAERAATLAPPAADAAPLAARSRRRRAGPARGRRRRSITALVAALAPQSLAAEQYRSLRTRDQERRDTAARCARSSSPARTRGTARASPPPTSR